MAFFTKRLFGKKKKKKDDENNDGFGLLEDDDDDDEELSLNDAKTPKEKEAPSPKKAGTKKKRGTKKHEMEDEAKEKKKSKRKKSTKPKKETSQAPESAATGVVVGDDDPETPPKCKKKTTTKRGSQKRDDANNNAPESPSKTSRRTSSTKPEQSPPGTTKSQDSGSMGKKKLAKRQSTTTTSSSRKDGDDDRVAQETKEEKVKSRRQQPSKASPAATTVETTTTKSPLPRRRPPAKSKSEAAAPGKTTTTKSPLLPKRRQPPAASKSESKPRPTSKPLQNTTTTTNNNNNKDDSDSSFEEIIRPTKTQQQQQQQQQQPPRQQGRRPPAKSKSEALPKRRPPTASKSETKKPRTSKPQQRNNDYSDSSFEEIIRPTKSEIQQQQRQRRPPAKSKSEALPKRRPPTASKSETKPKTSKQRQQQQPKDYSDSSFEEIIRPTKSEIQQQQRQQRGRRPPAQSKSEVLPRRRRPPAASKSETSNKPRPSSSSSKQQQQQQDYSDSSFEEIIRPTKPKTNNTNNRNNDDHLRRRSSSSGRRRPSSAETATATPSSSTSTTLSSSPRKTPTTRGRIQQEVKSYKPVENAWSSALDPSKAPTPAPAKSRVRHRNRPPTENVFENNNTRISNRTAATTSTTASSSTQDDSDINNNDTNNDNHQDSSGSLTTPRKQQYQSPTRRRRGRPESGVPSSSSSNDQQLLQSPNRWISSPRRGSDSAMQSPRPITRHPEQKLPKRVSQRNLFIERSNNSSGLFNNNMSAVNMSLMPDQYKGTDVDKKWIKHEWKFSSFQTNGNWNTNTEGEVDRVQGKSIARAIQKFKAHPKIYIAMIYPTEMLDWPEEEQQYTLIYRDGTTGLKPKGVSPNGQVTMLLQEYQPLPSLPKDNFALPACAQDKYTEAMEYNGRKLVTNNNKPFHPGRGTGLVDDPTLKIIGDIDPSDIAQGKCGNCWMLSGIASLAEYDGAIRRLFRKTPDLDQMPYVDGRPNMYTITLWDLVTWEEVDIVVDERLPARTDGSGLLFGAKPSSDGELWVCYLEKALAAHCGGWDMIDGGQPTHAWSLLTGCKEQYLIQPVPGESGQFKCTAKYDTDKERWMNHGNSPHEGFQGAWEVPWPKVGGGGTGHLSAEEVFLRMCEWDDKNYLLCASTKGRSDENETDGIVDCHAYSVIDCRNDIGGTGIDLIQLRNPWGKGEIENGMFGNKGQGWDDYPEIKKELKPLDADDGVFWATRDEFFTYFENIYLGACEMTEFLKVQRKPKAVQGEDLIDQLLEAEQDNPDDNNGEQRSLGSEGSDELKGAFSAGASVHGNTPDESPRSEAKQEDENEIRKMDGGSNEPQSPLQTSLSTDEAFLSPPISTKFKSNVMVYEGSQKIVIENVNEDDESSAESISDKEGQAGDEGDEKDTPKVSDDGDSLGSHSTKEGSKSDGGPNNKNTMEGNESHNASDSDVGSISREPTVRTSSRSFHTQNRTKALSAETSDVGSPAAREEPTYGSEEEESLAGETTEEDETYKDSSDDAEPLDYELPLSPEKREPPRASGVGVARAKADSVGGNSSDEEESLSGDTTEEDETYKDSSSEGGSMDFELSRSPKKSDSTTIDTAGFLNRAKADSRGGDSSEEESLGGDTTEEDESLKDNSDDGGSMTMKLDTSPEKSEVPKSAVDISGTDEDEKSTGSTTSEQDDSSKEMSFKLNLFSGNIENAESSSDDGSIEELESDDDSSVNGEGSTNELESVDEKALGEDSNEKNDSDGESSANEHAKNIMESDDGVSDDESSNDIIGSVDGGGSVNDESKSSGRVAGDEGSTNASDNGESDDDISDDEDSNNKMESDGVVPNDHGSNDKTQPSIEGSSFEDDRSSASEATDDNLGSSGGDSVHEDPNDAIEFDRDSSGGNSSDDSDNSEDESSSESISSAVKRFKAKADGSSVDSGSVQEVISRDGSSHFEQASNDSFSSLEEIMNDSDDD